MENVWHYLGLYLSLELADLCNGFPLSPTTGTGPDAAWASVSPLVSLVLLTSSVLLVFGCLCCRRTKGFQEFTDSGSTPNLSTPGGGYVNNASSTEFPLFPPPQPANQAIRFEPLPEIVPPNRTKKPAAFNNAVSHGLSEQDWFAEGPGVDFPRQQLQYVREAGRGWFGRVVEGNAQHIVSTTATTPVVVKILRADASPTDQMYFLHEVRAYRDLQHPNVLRMLGRCLESDPFLVLLEACPTGDLKSFLCQNKSTARALCDEGVTLNMACNIAAGLEHMLDNGFVHTDLAARNCLVTPDLTVKIGDYGHGIETFKEDYYIAGDIALPVRWCAPETVYCTDTTIQTKEVTPAANVWNLGVVLWEIAEFGKLPYEELTDDEVVGQVFGESQIRLALPSLPAPHRENLYLLMKLCWSSVEVRPALKQVHSMLKHLNSSRQRHQLDGQESSLRTEEDFNRRWETFKPNTIPKRDDHTHEPTGDVLPRPSEPDILSHVQRHTNIPPADTQVTLGGDLSALRSPLHLALDDHNNQLTSQNAFHGHQDGSDRITPSTTSPQLSLASSFGGEFFSNTIQTKDRSASLQNLRGSLDDLSDNVGVWDEGKKREQKKADSATKRDPSIGTVSSEEVDLNGSSLQPNFDSWLKGVETTDEEDAKFVAKISEAIRDLDEALALEKTSSSSSESSSKQHTPVKEVCPLRQNTVLDFRLGRMEVKQEREESSEESPRHSGSSDTEDETWRVRVERGEFTQKVKEKSKSVADLMVLTHIDPSDNSDSEPPSLTWSFERGSIRTSKNSYNGSFSRPVRDANRNSSALVSNSFGSEGDIHKAVLGEEFLESLQKIQIARRDSNKNILSEVASFLEHEKMHIGQTGIDFLPTNHNRETNFLAFDASGKKQTLVDAAESQKRDSPINTDSISCTELVGKVASVSIDNTIRRNNPVETNEVQLEVNCHVPDCQSDDNLILEISSPQIEDPQDSKLSVANNESLSVHSADCLADNVVENVLIPVGRESESIPVVPQIVIDEPSPKLNEIPVAEVFAKKPVPLPRRTLRLVCRESSEDSETDMPEVASTDSQIRLENQYPPLSTSTPLKPQAAPRSSNGSDALLGDTNKITVANVGFVVDTPVITNLIQSDVSINDSCPKSDDSHPIEERKTLLESVDSPTRLNEEVFVPFVNGDPFHVPTPTSVLETSSNLTQKLLDATDLISTSSDLLPDMEVSSSGEFHGKEHVYQSYDLTSSSHQKSDSLSFTHPAKGEVNLSALENSKLSLEPMPTEPLKSNTEFICTKPHQVKNDNELEGEIICNATEVYLEPVYYQEISTPDSKQDVHVESLVVATESSGDTCKQKLNPVANEIIGEQKTDPNGSTSSTSIDTAPCHIESQMAEKKAMSTIPSESVKTRTIESSVILGPCEDFTLEYFKGLKTTFPDSGQQAAFKPNFFLENHSHETDITPQVQGLPNGKASSIVGDDESNIDYSINGWDDFLGKTLEKQEVSVFDDVFPSLLPEQSLLPTANKVVSVFMPDFDPKDGDTKFPSTEPVEITLVKPPKAVDDISSISDEFKVEAINMTLCGPKVTPDFPSHIVDNDRRSIVDSHEDQITCTDVCASLNDSDNSLVMGKKEEQSLVCDSLPHKHGDFGSLDILLETETSEFSVPGFHLNVLEASDDLKEMEEHDVLAEFALDVKHCTPDDERSSDSGFRDKGSLSESCEDACDEKYNLEDIEAELEETFNQGGFNYKLDDEEVERYTSSEFLLETGSEMESNGILREESSVHDTNSTFPTNITSAHTSEILHEDDPIAEINVIPCSIMKLQPSHEDYKCLGLEDRNLIGSDEKEVCTNNLNIKDAQVSNDQGEPGEQYFGERILENHNGFQDKENCFSVKPSKLIVASDMSNTKKSGWYLHPPAPSTPENCPTDALEDYMSPKSESSTSSMASRHDDSENSYVSYHLDEEYVTAIRNELREKLPCANQALDSDSEEDIIDEEESGEERQDIMIHYNMYPAPLSPILEERESMSSIDYSPYVNSLNLDSEPESLVFSLDSQEEIRKETDAKKFEDDIREALENCSYESSSSSDRDPNTTVILEDLDNDGKQKALKVHGTSVEVEDDVLIVDTETNEARLVESPIPKLQLAFVNKRSIDQLPVLKTPDFMRDDEPLGVNSETFVISKSRFDGSLEGSSGTLSSGKNSVESDVCESSSQAVEQHATILQPNILPMNRGDVFLDLNLNHSRIKSDADSYTPDSISPTTASAGTIPTTDTDDASEFFLTPSDSSPINHPTPIPQPRCSAAQITTVEPSSDQVQNISLNFPNNEAAEIISDLEDCGIIGSSKPSPEKDILQLMTGEIFEYQDSTESSDEKYSSRSLEDDFEEMISFEDYSQSSESREYGVPTPESQMSLEFALSKPDFNGDMSPVQRLDFLTGSIAIVSESNEDDITSEDFEDELDRTLKLNDLDSILRLNTNALRGCKSMPSPNIHSSAKEIIVNFVKSKEHDFSFLEGHQECKSELSDLKLAQFNGTSPSEPHTKITLSHTDKLDLSDTANRKNELPNDSPNITSNWESVQISADIASQVSDKSCVEQKIKAKESMETLAENEAIVTVQLATLDSDLKFSTTKETVVSDSSESETYKTNSSLQNSGQIIINLEDSQSNEETEEIGKNVKDASNNIVIGLKQDIIDDSNDNTQNLITCSIVTDAAKPNNEINNCEILTTPDLERDEEHASVEDCKVQDLAIPIVFLENSKQNGALPLAIGKCPDITENSSAVNHVADPDEITIELDNLESGLKDWSHFRESTRAPMPSPEEESWCKLSSSMLSFPNAPASSDQKVSKLSASMLGFSPDISPDRDASSSDAKDSPLGDLPFDRDFAPSSMLGFSDEKISKMPDLSFVGPGYEDGEMSTSFSAPGEEEEEDYAPDWESDSEGSSSSGEFIWREGEREAPARDLSPQVHTNTRYLPKPYECLPEFPMEVIEEEEEDEDDDDDDDDEDSSLGSGTEFVPSAWDSQATPSRSALRSPDKKTDGKKNVWFKKQKYHCVYEYPRENSDTEGDSCEASFADSHPWQPQASVSSTDNTNQPWRHQTVNSPSQASAQVPVSWQPPAVDYSAYADWEVTDGDDQEQDTDTESDNQVLQPKAEPFDFYKLSNVDYDFSTGVISEDGEFFISSSARPFQQFNATPSNLFNQGSSQFFPGQSHTCEEALDQSQTNIDSFEQGNTFTSDQDSFADEIDTSPRNIAGSKLSSLVQEGSLTQNIPNNERVEFDGHPCEVLSGKNRDMGDLSENNYSVNTENENTLKAGKNENLSAIVLNLKNSTDRDMKINGSDREYCDSGPTPPSPLSPSCGLTPPSPLSPTGLGELRHTRDRLKLNLPSTNGAFLLDVPSKWARGPEGGDDTNTAFLLDAPGKSGRTLLERGEASLLDSGEETEDSGIESSNGMSATLTLKTTLEENISNALAHVH